jgi:uncharacterized membrane protein YjgN (DUF898 family)
MSYNAPPPPPPGQPYGTPGGYAAPIEHPKGTTILVLGILSLVCCSILGPFAWVMGNKAIAEIDASGQAFSNRGQINAGRICGIVATVLMVLGIVFYAVLAIVAIATNGNS